MIRNLLIALLPFAALCNKALSASVDGTCPGGYREGTRVDRDPLWYECRNGQLVARGCIGPGGREISTGDTFESGDKFYYCMDRNGVVTADVIGCVRDNQRLKDGDQIVKESAVYQCNVRGTNPSTAELKVAACLSFERGTRIERRLGCSWIEGDAPFQHTHTCQEEGNSARRLAVACNYELPNGSFTIDIGCYKVIDKVGVACMKGDDAGDVKFVSIPVDEKGQVRSPPPGLRQC